MSNLVKNDNLDDDGNWVVNFRISIEDVKRQAKKLSNSPYGEYLLSLSKKL